MKELKAYMTVTDILFYVITPVRSTRILSVKPIISQELKFSTYIFSFCKCDDADASATVVANGRPSGITKITIVKLKIIKFNT